VEAARRARRRKAIGIRLFLALVAVALVGALALNALGDRREASSLQQRLTAGECTFDSRSDRTDPAPNNHVANPTYRVNPPAGGNHSSRAASAGIYEEANVPADGELVHSLEHGYVIVWHRPDISEEDKQGIREVATRFERDVLVVPRASLPQRVAATAWGERLLCPGVEKGPLGEFIESYRNKGPERIPH
jgi:hypothetical protein